MFLTSFNRVFNPQIMTVIAENRWKQGQSKIKIFISTSALSTKSTIFNYIYNASVMILLNFKFVVILFSCDNYNGVAIFNTAKLELKVRFIYNQVNDLKFSRLFLWRTGLVSILNTVEFMTCSTVQIESSCNFPSVEVSVDEF